MRHRRRETDRRHPVYLITRVNHSDISQRGWNLTRPGVPKLQRMQHHQRAPVRYFVRTYQIRSRTGAKLSFKGIMRMADEAEMWLILLIPRYFNNLQGWKIVTSGDESSVSPEGQSSLSPIPEPPAYEDGDIPF